MLPLIQKSVLRMPFALAMRDRFTAFASLGNLTFPSAPGLAKDLTGALINALNLSMLRSQAGVLTENGRQPLPIQLYQDNFQTRHMFTLSDATRVVTESRLSSLFADCIKNGWMDLEDLLAKQIISQAHSIPPTEFTFLWFPVLRKLLTLLGKDLLPPTTTRYRDIFVAILTAYLERYVQREPVVDPSWAKSPLPCNCSDCIPINDFLRSPTETLYHINLPYTGKRRTHLRQ